MKPRKTWQWIIAAAVLAFAAAHASAAEPRKEDAVLSAKLLGAIENSNYDAFVAEGIPEFIRGVPREGFGALCAQMAPRLKAEHTVTFLGELRQQGFRVTLWKLSFADGSDDALATLSVREGKVGGFWIR